MLKCDNNVDLPKVYIYSIYFTKAASLIWQYMLPFPISHSYINLVAGPGGVLFHYWSSHIIEDILI